MPDNRPFAPDGETLTMLRTVNEHGRLDARSDEP